MTTELQTEESKATLKEEDFICTNYLCKMRASLFYGWQEIVTTNGIKHQQYSSVVLFFLASNQ